jgi:hypothetical protein
VLFYNRLRNYLVKQSRSFDENIQLFQTAIEQLKQPTPYRLKPLKEHIKNLDLQSILEARRVLVREIKATNNALDAMEYRPEVLSSWEAEYASAAPTEADADDSLIQPQLAHLPAEAAVPKSCLLKEEDKGKGKRVKFNEEGKCAPPEDRK